MHKAFCVIATFYIEDALNLVDEAVSTDAEKAKILARADVIFGAWEQEIASLKTAILTVPGLGAKSASTRKTTNKVS